MKLQPNQLLSVSNRSNNYASSASPDEGSIFSRLRGSTDDARQGQSVSSSDSGLDRRSSPFESMTIEHNTVVAMLSRNEMTKGSVGGSSPRAATSDGDSVNNQPVSITIPTLVGDVEIETKPNESWEELPSDAAGGAAVAIAGAQAVVWASTAAPPLTAPVVAVLGATGAVGGVVSGTDTDVSVTPNIFSAGLAALANLWSNIVNPATPNPLTSTTTSSDSDGSGMTSAESAEAGNFGTHPEGEFGGTPTAPAPEPVSQPTSSPRPDPNRNGENESDSHGGVSSGPTSAESAEQGGFGTSEQGEFG